jgi:hypothetical protein
MAHENVCELANIYFVNILRPEVPQEYNLRLQGDAS